MTTAQRKQPNYMVSIHVAQKNMGMTEDDARAIKLQLTGKESCKSMSQTELRKVSIHLGALIAKTSTSRNDSADSRWLKARKLWSSLHTAGKVQKNTDKAMREWVKGQTKCDEWRWLNHHQVNTVIESLKAWLNR